VFVVRLLECIIGWEVSSESSLSDYKHILFILLGSIPVCLIRNPRNTIWGSFKEDLRDQLERGPAMDMKSEGGLGLVIHWLQQALTLAYENTCPIKPVKKCRQSLKWTTELEDAWRGFCSSTDDLPKSARLHRSLSRDLTIKFGSLVAPSGRRTQSEGETLEILLTTHFPRLRGYTGVSSPCGCPPSQMPRLEVGYEGDHLQKGRMGNRYLSPI
jgi:hypothetical protein